MAYTEDQIKQLMANELGQRDGLDFSSDTNEAVRKINASYPLIVRTALQRYRWGFANTTVKLDTPNDLTDNKYKYSYELPTDFLKYITSFNDANRLNPIIDYDPPLKGLLDCNVKDQVYLNYTADVDVSLYTDYFVDYLKLKGAFELCYDLTGDTQLLQVLQAREAKQWAISTNIDTVQKRTRRIANAPYISVRG